MTDPLPSYWTVNSCDIAEARRNGNFLYSIALSAPQFYLKVFFLPLLQIQLSHLYVDMSICFLWESSTTVSTCSVWGNISTP